jgi:hypothetical protein
MIVTLLLHFQGFYSILFFVLNHYLYCKKNRLNYRINTNDWLHKSVNGWTDYFTNLELNYEDDVSKDVIFYDQKNTILDTFSLNEYRNAISEIYLYNEKIKSQIDETKQFHNLNNNYSCIFIRRGDKLISESNYYNASSYIETLLSIEPDCKRIFIQTDDYNCIIEAREYIKTNNISVEILTLCNENIRGMVIRSEQLINLHNVLNDRWTSSNKNYLVQNIDSLLQFKPVDKMDSAEVFDHTAQMLVGIDIVLHSKICVLDYESNVSRFIKLAHAIPDNVFDINKKVIDLNTTLFPAYGF